MKKVILFICLLLFSQNFLAQEIASIYTKRSELKDNSLKKNINKRPLYDVNVGISRVSGLRLGGRILFSKHLSFEAAFGLAVSQVFIVSSEETNLSLGLNIHFLDKKNVTLSFLSAFLNDNNSTLKLSFLSTTFGIMIPNKKGSHFFIRIGPYVESITKGSFSKGNFGVNLDLGYNFVF